MYKLYFLLSWHTVIFSGMEQKPGVIFSNEYSFLKKADQCALLQDSIFILKGNIKGQDKGRIKLIYTDKNGKYILDSTLVKKGRFQFHGNITEPTMVFLEGDTRSNTMEDPNFTSFFLEPSNITIELVYNDFKNAVVTGSKTHQEYIEINNLIAPINKEWEPISREFEKVAKVYRKAVKAKKDEKIIDSLKKITDEYREKYTPFSNRIKKTEHDFFLKHPKSFITALRLPQHMMDMPLDSLQLLFDNLGAVTQQTSAGKMIAKEIEQLRGGSPGSMAKDFTATDLQGSQLSLAYFKGKYVLLDFWASWCIPCRKGNPHLKELYAKYKDKGIEFIGIADDDQEEGKWKEAIAKDGIGIWRHVRRGMKYKNNSTDHSNDINNKFGIQSLPTKILIDKEGKIIGRYSEDEGPLDEMLKKVFGE